MLSVHIITISCCQQWHGEGASKQLPYATAMSEAISIKFNHLIYKSKYTQMGRSEVPREHCPLESSKRVTS